jgi:septal ring factor EnvC (AmiA/AmiB activator)
LAGKLGRGTKISGLILLSLAAGVATGQTGGGTLRSVSHYDREITQSKKQLDAVRTELEKGRRKLKELQQEEGNYLGQLEQLEKNISASHNYLSLLDQKIDTVSRHITLLNDSLDDAGKRLVARQKVMSRRLRQAYMQGRVHPLISLFRLRSPLEVINRVRYMEELNRYDRTLAEQIEHSRREIDKKKQVQQQERSRLEDLRGDKVDEQKALVKEEHQRKKTLGEVRQKKEAFASMVKELEASQKELAAMIKLLEKQRRKAREGTSRQSIATFEKRKGSLPWPVEGPVITKFGKVVHPVYQTVILNNGIDIGADNGDDVRSIAAGTVIHTGWMRGLGKMVIVDHVGGYLSIYAHLQDISVEMNQNITPDQKIGTVGETGSLGGAKLHFEIRKSAVALNPVEWLEKK